MLIARSLGWSSNFVFMDKQQYEDYIASVVSEWAEGTIAPLFCVCGMVEEVDEFHKSITEILQPEEVLSESGDVMFYIFCLRYLFGLDANSTKIKSISLKKKLTSESISLMKHISKHICFGSKIELDIVKKNLDLIEASIQKQTEIYCEKFSISVDLTKIIECNFIKLTKRYPMGRNVQHVTKDTTAENEIIKKNIYGTNKA